MRRILIVSLGLISISTIPLLVQKLQAQSGAAPVVRSQAAKSAVGKGNAAEAKTSSAKSAATKAEALVPLTERERAEQLLNRFTFGARPGDVDRVLAMGAEKWFEQQLNPDAIPNIALDRRLTEFPTLNMTAEQALTVFPSRVTLQQVGSGVKPMPTDPLLAAEYEVLETKLKLDNRKPDANGVVAPAATDTELAAGLVSEKQQGQATAARIAGALFALAKNQRMAALAKMPVEERIAFTSYVGGDQKTQLLADFTPREREIFLAMAANVGASYQIGQELAQAKMVRAILSERQLQEVLTDFWFNHFNIFIGKEADQWYTTSYERDAIRKNALGKFGDLLLATAQSPAMMVYLDNWQSIGPDSLANGVNPANPRSKPGNKGLNENYGREVMELHAVGVDGGYSQADVTNLAAILTGWTVDRPFQGGAFQFDARRHEPGTKTWMGHAVGSGAPFVIQGTTAKVAMAAAKSAPPMEDAAMEMDGMQMGGGAEQSAIAQANAPGNEGMKEGVEALNLLAHSPQTAHFICWKIAQRFVADDPPPALVDRMAKTFLASDGDIKAVLRTLVASPEFNSKKYFRNKVKTPMEFLTSAYRSTLTEPANPAPLVFTMRAMGMELYHALPPTGYGITADKWMNTNAVVDRLNFAVQLTNGRFGDQKFDAAKVVALGLLSEQSPAAQAEKQTGTEIALRILESTLIGGEVSAKTNELIHQQIAQQSGPASGANAQAGGPNAQIGAQGANSGDVLNRMTALVMGSPEFQMR
jgi:uncharacterized protein (DUF1800 family)